MKCLKRQPLIVACICALVSLFDAQSGLAQTEDFFSRHASGDYTNTESENYGNSSDSSSETKHEERGYESSYLKYEEATSEKLPRIHENKQPDF